MLLKSPQVQHLSQGLGADNKNVRRHNLYIRGGKGVAQHLIIQGQQHLIIQGQQPQSGLLNLLKKIIMPMVIFLKKKKNQFQIPFEFLSILCSPERINSKFKLSKLKFLPLLLKFLALLFFQILIICYSFKFHLLNETNTNINNNKIINLNNNDNNSFNLNNNDNNDNIIDVIFLSVTSVPMITEVSANASTNDIVQKRFMLLSQAREMRISYVSI